MKKAILFFMAAIMNSSFVVAQGQIISSSPTNPTNSWFLHTPADGRTSLHIAPFSNGNWAWDKQAIFLNDGSLGIAGAYPAEKVTANGNLMLLTASTNAGDLLSQVKFSNGGYNTSIIGYQSGTYRNNLGLIFRVEQGGSGGSSVLVNAMSIRHTGSVLIGTPISEAFLDNYKLNVSGGVRANSIVVNTTGADFVFEKNYILRPLSEVESFIKANNHLPEIAPAAKMRKEGVNVGELQTQLLQKIEELTLYMIEQSKRVEKQAMRLNELEKENAQLKKEIISLK